MELSLRYMNITTNLAILDELLSYYQRNIVCDRVT